MKVAEKAPDHHRLKEGLKMASHSIPTSPQRTLPTMAGPAGDAAMTQAVRACYQRILKGEKILVEEVALRALEEPEDELTPLEALERSLNITIAAAACEAACEWATEQLERSGPRSSPPSPHTKDLYRLSQQQVSSHRPLRSWATSWPRDACAGRL